MDRTHCSWIRLVGIGWMDGVSGVGRQASLWTGANGLFCYSHFDWTGLDDLTVAARLENHGVTKNRYSKVRRSQCRYPRYCTLRLMFRSTS